MFSCVFFKQKTAYEMRISDWSSDVCSSDLSGNLDHALFVDQANAEYSRDIEPTWTAGLRDHYYMQMVSNIRRYKGTESVPVSPISKKRISRWSDWEDRKSVG